MKVYIVHETKEIVNGYNTLFHGIFVDETLAVKCCEKYPCAIVSEMKL